MSAISPSLSSSSLSSSSSSSSCTSNNKKRPAVPLEEIQDVREPAAKKRPVAATEDELIEQIARVRTDACRIAGLKPGDRMEVRWDLRVENDERSINETTGGGGTVSRWWGATLLHPDGRAHVTLGDDNSESSAAAPVRVLDYDPRYDHDYGYPHRALEDVVFLSDHVLLHLSHSSGDGAGGGRTYYRREGSVWEPPSGEPAVEYAARADKVTEGDIGDILDSVLVEALRGMSDKASRLSAAQRRAVAARIANAREKMLAKLME